ncbi:MAG: hypothetical protein ACW7DS_16775 [Paraglaciecola chathamensis]
MSNHDDYHSEMIKAMEKCQFIEETLKLCILSAIEIVKLTTSSYFSLNYSISEIAKLPMGPLVKKFSRICDDDQLIKDLRSITKERNFVAHQSLLFTLGELSNTESAKQALGRLKTISSQATDIHNRLLDVRYKLVRDKQQATRGAIESNA